MRENCFPWGDLVHSSPNRGIHTGRWQHSSASLPSSGPSGRSHMMSVFGSPKVTLRISWWLFHVSVLGMLGLRAFGQRTTWCPTLAHILLCPCNDPLISRQWLSHFFQVHVPNVHRADTTEHRACQKLTFSLANNNSEKSFWYSLWSSPQFFSFSDCPIENWKSPLMLWLPIPFPCSCFSHGLCHLLTYCMFCLVIMCTVHSSH